MFPILFYFGVFVFFSDVVSGWAWIEKPKSIDLQPYKFSHYAFYQSFEV